MKPTGCWHCGEPLPEQPPLAVVAGSAHPVCCHGCRAAAEWIDRLGLADYYRLRSAPSARAPEPQAAARSARAWQRPQLARHVVRVLDAGRSEVLLLVDGIRCAACVWLIERALGALAGVQAVQVNAAAQHARVVWDPARTDLGAILEALARTGYQALPLDAAALDDHRRHEARSAIKRLAVAGFGAMQAMMYASALYLGALTDIDPATRELMRWLGLLVATPVVFYSARPFFAGAWRSLRARTLGMDVPVAIAIALIYAASIVEALRGRGEVYFDSVSMFVFFLLVGRFLEMRARHRAGSLVDALARTTPAYAERLRADGGLERIGALELEVGDQVQVAEGERVPADGVLASRACRVDEALLSGESAPVAKRQGDPLVGGSLLLEGPATMRVTRVGADTALAGIAALVARAHSQRPRQARAGERAAAGFVARVLALAALCAIGWSLVDPARALTATLAVLVVSCPCAFALAVPAALTRALAVLAARGVFVVRPDAIEDLALATHVVFDKTGTLTCAELELAAVQGGERAPALALAAALARGSTHPAARALVRAAAELPLPAAAEVRSVRGQGIEGVVDGRRLRLGQPGWAIDATANGAAAAGVAATGTAATSAAATSATATSAATASVATASAATTSAATTSVTATSAAATSVTATSAAATGVAATGTAATSAAASGAAASGLAATGTATAAAPVDDDAVVLAEGARVLAVFRLREQLRAGARQALAALRADGLNIELASGDAQAKVDAVAQRLGIEQRHARLSPAAKLARLQALRAGGARIVAVGDGVNDAPVLAGADVAVALASGSELARASGDLVLDGAQLAALAQARTLARQTLAVLRQNQRWALAYNLAVVPLGALGFVPPWLAAIGMSASSLVVILNALRIGRQLPRLPAAQGAARLQAAA